MIFDQFLHISEQSNYRKNRPLFTYPRTMYMLIDSSKHSVYLPNLDPSKLLPDSNANNQYLHISEPSKCLQT